MVSFHDEKSAFLCQKIEFACFNFIENLFSPGFKNKKYIKMTINSKNESGYETKDRKLFLSQTRPKAFCFHVQVLNQIYQMLLIGQKATKRDLFYERKNLFKVQPTFNRSLKAICKFLGSNRKHLRVIGSSRGFAIGNLLIFNNSDDVVDFRHNAVALFEKFMDYKFFQSTANLVLIVEKDAIFQKLIDENFCDQFPNAILVTGKGYPDICTREFVYNLSNRINAKFFALMDADPYGIEIFLTYKYGSKIKNFESSVNNRIYNLSLIGLRISELKDLPITTSHYLLLSELDKKKCWNLLNRLKFINKENDDLINEVNLIKEYGFKLELESLSSISPNYLSSVYLSKKFQCIKL